MLLDVFTHDDRFYETAAAMKKEGKEVSQMCDVLDRIEARGITKGRQEGRLDGQIIVFKNMIRRGFSVKEAMSIAEITEEQAQNALRELGDK